MIANKPPETIAEIFERKARGRERHRALPLFVKMELAIEMYHDRVALTGIRRERPKRVKEATASEDRANSERDRRSDNL